MLSIPSIVSVRHADLNDSLQRKVKHKNKYKFPLASIPIPTAVRRDKQ
jgi:hypothetical protein